MSRKPQSLTRRAEAYAARKSKIGVPSPRETEAWADGYRAAMRDVRKTWPDDREYPQAVWKLANDTERMK